MGEGKFDKGIYVTLIIFGVVVVIGVLASKLM